MHSAWRVCRVFGRAVLSEQTTTALISKKQEGLVRVQTVRPFRIITDNLTGCCRDVPFKLRSLSWVLSTPQPRSDRSLPRFCEQRQKGWQLHKLSSYPMKTTNRQASFHSLCCRTRRRYSDRQPCNLLSSRGTPIMTAFQAHVREDTH